MWFARKAGARAEDGWVRKVEPLLERYWCVLVILIAIPLYGMNLNYGDLWNDETFTKELVSFPLPRFATLFGSSAIALRAFSTVAVFGTLILICGVGSRVLGKRGALLLCLVLLAHQLQIKPCKKLSYITRNARVCQ